MCDQERDELKKTVVELSQALAGPLAQRLFSAVQGAGRLESELTDELDKILGPDNWTDYIYDWYDVSLEILGCAHHLLSEEQLAAFQELGFRGVWIHPGPTKVRDLEKYYRLWDRSR